MESQKLLWPDQMCFATMLRFIFRVQCKLKTKNNVLLFLQDLEQLWCRGLAPCLWSKGSGVQNLDLATMVSEIGLLSPPFYQVAIWLK